MGRYVVRKRARFDSITGPVNIPYGTSIVENDGFLYTEDGRKLCAITSRNSHLYFSIDDDGNGKLRGALVSSICKVLGIEGNEPWVMKTELWDRLFSDPVCAKYRKKTVEDRWIWSHDFYVATIEDLRYINKLLGGKYHDI